MNGHWGIRRVAGKKAAQDYQVAKVQAEPRSVVSRKAWQRLGVPMYLKRIRGGKF